MKNKLRNIVVDERRFKWLVGSISKSWVCLKVWIPENKRDPWIQVRCRFDDLWLNFQQLVSPSDEERWRQEYNIFRPHSALKYKPPAPEATQPRLLDSTWLQINMHETLTLKVVH